jgi:hypothetical protein
MSAEKGSIKMKAKIIFLALFLATCLAVSVWAQAPQDPGVYGGFYGDIHYQNCTCNMADQVKIQSTSGGQAYLYYIERCGGNPGYTTAHGSPSTFIPGNYYISAALHEGSDCDHTYVQMVQHGYADQKVDLTVYGPSGGGNGPSGP